MGINTKKIILSSLVLLIGVGFSSRKVKNKKLIIAAEDCGKKFSKSMTTSKKKMDQIISAYKVFPCFPVETLNFLESKHPDETWVLSELAKLRILTQLEKEPELMLSEKLLPYIDEKSDKEKILLKIIKLKKELRQPYEKEQKMLWAQFPSHNENRLKNPDLTVVSDMKRRGLNTEALELLNELHKKDPRNFKVMRSLISTQKNIKRDSEYLRYSQKYVNAVYASYKRNRGNSYLKSLYLDEALKNIRRIWTYQSTELALKKLNTLIKYHCKPARRCSEHYWIKGRVHEELGQTKSAHIWLRKAVENTAINHSEYQNRVWNLVWLESKILGPKQALYSASLYLSNINEKEVHSKHYYWMSRWSPDKESQQKYVDLIKKHHPMSFYLWSKYALGQGLELKTQNFKTFRKNIKAPRERELLRIMEAGELSLARAYIKNSERTSKIKKTMSWKKLKALNGMYADLQLDLKAGNLDPKENLHFFFSRGFYDEVIQSGEKFSIDKELIWSITRQESNFDPYARSWADAFGLMQILPRRAVNYLNDTKPSPEAPTVQAINPFKLYDPSLNIDIGAWLLKENLREFKGKLPLAIAAYNASVKKVEEWERRFYNGDWMTFMEEVTYRETRKYVKLVLRNKEIYSALEKSSLEEAKN